MFADYPDWDGIKHLREPGSRSLDLSA